MKEINLSEKSKKLILILNIILVFIFIVSAVSYFIVKSNINTNIDKYDNLNFPYKAIHDINSNKYIIDSSKGRILKVNNANEIQFQITSKNNSFSNAQDIAVSKKGDFFYVLDVVWRNVLLEIETENIKKYDSNGNYISTVFSKTYDKNHTIKYTDIFGLKEIDGELLFVYADSNGFSLMKTGQDNPIYTYTYESAQTTIQDFAINPYNNSIYFTDRRGLVVSCNEKDGIRNIYKTPENSLITPHSIQFSNNNVYFVDLCESIIYRVNNNNIEKVIGVKDIIDPKLLDPYADVIYTFSVLEKNNETSQPLKNFITVFNNNLYESNLDTNESFIGDRFEKTDSYLMKEFILYVSIIFMVLIVLYFIIILLIKIFSKPLNLSTPQKISSVILLTIVIASIFVITNMSNQFGDVIRSDVLGNVTTLSKLASKTIDPELVESIDSSDDYMNDNYKNLYQQVNQFINSNNENSESKYEIYYLVSKYQHNLRYYIMSLQNSLGALCPLYTTDAQEQEQVYNTKQELNNKSGSTIEGSYIYSKSPIINKNNEVVGVIEVGCNNSLINLTIQKLILSSLVNIALLIVTVIFFVNEMLSIWTIFHKEKNNKIKSTKKHVPMYILRPIIFISFVAFNMSSSFLPIYILSFYSEKLGIPESLAPSLPISINLIFLALTALFCTKLLNKFGFKNVILLGSFFACLGQLLLALSNSYFLIVFALILDAIGCGIIINSINTHISNFATDDEKQDGFSIVNASSTAGINFGTVLGALIAMTFQNINVFYTATGIWASIFIGFILFGKRIRWTQKSKETLPKTSTSLISFIFSKKIISYIIFINIPYLIVSGFIFYFIPVYGNNYNLDLKEISLLLVLYSLSRIFLSGSLTKFVNLKFKHYAIFISSSISFLALASFAWRPTFYSMVITTFLLGLASSFGNTVNIQHFLNIDDSKRYGEERSIGIYNFINNLGYSIGPLAFGFILNIGIFSGILSFVAISLTFLFIYQFYSYFSKKLISK